jgi:hypothetical protein
MVPRYICRSSTFLQSCIVPDPPANPNDESPGAPPGFLLFEISIRKLAKSTRLTR